MSFVLTTNLQKQNAMSKVRALRDLSETYTTSIPNESSLKDMSVKESARLLREYPDTIGKHYQELVVKTGLVGETQFWKRYKYRCNVDRILQESQQHLQQKEDTRRLYLACGLMGAPLPSKSSSWAVTIQQDPPGPKKGTHRNAIAEEESEEDTTESRPVEEFEELNAQRKPKDADVRDPPTNGKKKPTPTTSLPLNVNRKAPTTTKGSRDAPALSIQPSDSQSSCVTDEASPASLASTSTPTKFATSSPAASGGSFLPFAIMIAVAVMAILLDNYQVVSRFMCAPVIPGMDLKDGTKTESPWWAPSTINTAGICAPAQLALERGTFTMKTQDNQLTRKSIGRVTVYSDRIEVITKKGAQEHIPASWSTL